MANQIDHNSPEQLALKQYYPEGRSLQRDRSIRAEHVFKPTQIDKWIQMGVNRSDLQDFDTPNAREPSEHEIKSKLHSGMQVGYVESEPERFMHESHETRKLLEQEKANIQDYKTFKQAVHDTWGKDRSLRDLVKNMFESDYESLFRTGAVQGWLQGNTREFIISGLQHRFNIERGRAETVYSKLTDENREKVLTSLQRGHKFTVQQRPEPTPTVMPQPNLVRQKSRKGTEYARQKPVKWSDLQIEFMQNNRAVPLKPLTGLYNQTFAAKRTKDSLRNKRSRMHPQHA